MPVCAPSLQFQMGTGFTGGLADTKAKEMVALIPEGASLDIKIPTSIRGEHALIANRRLQHQLIFLCKIKYNLQKKFLPQHLIVPCTRTRNSDPNIFVQIPTRINTYAYSFYPRVIRACNLLPNEIIRLSSIDTFHQAVSTVQLAPPAHLNRL